jgi:hypothetical protein
MLKPKAVFFVLPASRFGLEGRNLRRDLLFKVSSDTFKRDSSLARQDDQGKELTDIKIHTCRIWTMKVGITLRGVLTQHKQGQGQGRG